jgi:hypothetical protein
MAMGLRIWDAASNVEFDSESAVGFLPVGIFEVAPGAGGFTTTYPDFAGFTPTLLPSDAAKDSVTGVAVDVALGYPRMIVTGGAAAQRLWMLLLS